MEKGLINIAMEVYLKDTIKMDKNMEQDYINGLMVKLLKVIGLIINYMEMLHFMKMVIKILTLHLDLEK